jgi:nitrate/TMAO reductase-like tetraheme cytochrome c subunit
MRRSTLLLATLALMAAPAFATPTAVKGAKCSACHEKMPPKKDNLNKMAAMMLKMHKTVASCKECHGVADGKLTVIKKK